MMRVKQRWENDNGSEKEAMADMGKARGDPGTA